MQIVFFVPCVEASICIDPIQLRAKTIKYSQKLRWLHWILAKYSRNSFTTYKNRLVVSDSFNEQKKNWNQITKLETPVHTVTVSFFFCSLCVHIFRCFCVGIVIEMSNSMRFPQYIDGILSYDFDGWKILRPIACLPMLCFNGELWHRGQCTKYKTKRKKNQSNECCQLKCHLVVHTQTKWQLNLLFIWIDPNALTVKLFSNKEKHFNQKTISRQHIPNK